MSIYILARASSYPQLIIATQMEIYTFMPPSTKHSKESSSLSKNMSLSISSELKKNSTTCDSSLIDVNATLGSELAKSDVAHPIIMSGHQPTLLPYPGFFYRMFHSNIMDICPYDPFSRHSDRYQHRVKIGNDENWRWLTLPVVSYTGCSIMDVKLKTHLMNDRWSLIEDVYGKYPLWNEYKKDLKSIFFCYDNLWELNLRLILWIRDLLRIRTYVSISWPGMGSNTTERISYQFADYGSVLYLAGKMSSKYLDIKKYEDMTNSKVAVVTYTPPNPFSTVTTLTPLLMYSPSEVLQVLKITEGPTKVLINGHEENIEKSVHRVFR